MIATPTNTPSRKPSPAAGFTLVELLMVIVLIAILVGLITFAAQRALNRGGEARTLTEMSLLSTAIEQYKLEYGSYPPNPGTDNTARGEMGFENATQQKQRFTRHISRAFPRYTGDYETAINTATTNTSMTGTPYEDGLGLVDLDPAEALVFWIGGLPRAYEDADGNLTYEVTGFSSNPANPFQSADEQPQRTEKLFDFNPARLVDRDNDGWPEYIPQGNSAAIDPPPYVYFDAPTYQLGARYPWGPTPEIEESLADGDGLGWGYCTPYARRISLNTASPYWSVDWASPDSFQLIAAGADGRYNDPRDPANPTQIFPPVTLPASDERSEMTVPVYTTGENFTVSDMDNLTNFSDSRLENASTDEGANP